MVTKFKSSKRVDPNWASRDKGYSGYLKSVYTSSLSVSDTADEYNRYSTSIGWMMLAVVVGLMLLTLRNSVLATNLDVIGSLIAFSLGAAGIFIIANIEKAQRPYMVSLIAASLIDFGEYAVVVQGIHRGAFIGLLILGFISRIPYKRLERWKYILISAVLAFIMWVMVPVVMNPANFAGGMSDVITSIVVVLIIGVLPIFLLLSYIIQSPLLLERSEWEETLMGEEDGRNL